MTEIYRENIYTLVIRTNHTKIPFVKLQLFSLKHFWMKFLPTKGFLSFGALCGIPLKYTYIWPVC